MLNPKSKIKNPKSLLLLPILLLSLHARAAVTATTTMLPSAESRIVWEPELRIKRTERVFAGRHEINRAWVATPQGIQETLDAGANWTLIPNTSHEQIGRIADVIFSPANSDLIFVATREKGIFRSKDNGKTFQNVGTLATGLKSLHISRLICDPADQSGRIVYAAHGDAVPGISKTVDGGNTWFTLAEGYVVQELLLEKRELWMGGHVVDDEDNWAIYGSSDAGETWAEDQRDVRTTVAGLQRIGLGTIWFGALKGPLMFRPPLERHRNFGDWRKAGPESGEWASIFGTFGRTFDEDLLFAYDPHHYGLVCSRDGFKTWWPENANLFVGKLVKEGANICCSATGRTFYASINSELYIGRLADKASDGPVISEFTVTPSVVKAAKGTPISVSVKVLPFDKDPKSAIKLVHVNLTAVRGPVNFNLVDDGKHGAGVFSGTFQCTDDYTNMWNPGDHRLHIPGQVLISVNAQDGKNRVTSDTIPITLYSKPSSFYFWDGETVKGGEHMTDGRRTTSFDGRHGDIFNMPVEARSGTHCLHVVALNGPWIVGWGSESAGHNLFDMDYLTFWVKTKAVSKRDIKVLLTDTPGGEGDARQSEAVWLIKDGYLKELNTQYQQVRIPIAKFMSKSGGFCMDMVGGVAFGGDDPTGHSFYVDDIGFEVEGAPLK